jgi:hypothetical protein
MNKSGKRARKNFKSSLNTLLKKPDATRVQENNEKTLALKILSLDLNTLEPKK